ncbi:MAG: aspartate/glutamate racemase family protein [Candidatus Micrarchaeia archaeon]
MLGDEKMTNQIRILDLVPIPLTPDAESFLITRREYSKYLSDITKGYISLETRVVKEGMASIENFFDEAVNTLSILRSIRSIKSDEFDAIIIDCMGDPGLDAAREISDIPIVGALESSVHLASVIGDPFGIVGILESTIPAYYFAIRKYGLQNKLAGIKSINVPVLDIDKNREITMEKTLSVIKELTDMGANSILLGCTGLISFVQELQKHTNVPIIDPLAAAVGLVVQIKITGTFMSKKLWSKLPPKDFIGGNLW